MYSYVVPGCSWGWIKSIYFNSNIIRMPAGVFEENLSSVISSLERCLHMRATHVQTRLTRILSRWHKQSFCTWITFYCGTRLPTYKNRRTQPNTPFWLFLTGFHFFNFYFNRHFSERNLGISCITRKRWKFMHYTWTEGSLIFPSMLSNF